MADMIAMIVTGKAMQHASSLMEELHFLAVVLHTGRDIINERPYKIWLMLLQLN